MPTQNKRREPSFDSTSVFIVNELGELVKVSCPFRVKILTEVPFLRKEGVYNVSAVMSSKGGLLVYIIKGKPFYYFNFIVLD